ncbi:MAG: TIGR04255 family protein [Saprospiraceae bacterium]
MNLPSKISPNFIKDSLVEVKYFSKIPLEVLVGFIFKALDNSFKYTSQPIPSKKTPLQQFGNIPVQLNFNLGTQYLFYTDRIRIQLLPNSIIFNCIDDYIGWGNYISEISTTLIQISSVKEIEFFSRIGVRYRSEHIGPSLNSSSKFVFSLGGFEQPASSFQFRSEFLSDGYRIIINLANNASKTTLNDFTSLFDIDVISENLSITSLEELISSIKKVHQKEKDIFFNLLREEYLTKLNPEYN